MPMPGKKPKALNTFRPFVILAGLEGIIDQIKGLITVFTPIFKNHMVLQIINLANSPQILTNWL
jgi:hypothetical protein